MKTRYAMPNTRALLGALGGTTEQDAYDRELDRLMKLDLGRSTINRNEAMGRKYGVEADVIDSGRRNLTDQALDLEEMVAASGAPLPVVKTMVDALRGVEGAVMPGADQLPDVMRDRALAAWRARMSARSATQVSNAKDMAEGAVMLGDLANRNRGADMWAANPKGSAGYLAAGSRQPPPALFQPLGQAGTMDRFTGSFLIDPSVPALNQARAERERAIGDAARERASIAAAGAVASVPRAPIGYQWNENFSRLEPIPGGPKDMRAAPGSQPGPSGVAAVPPRPLPASALKMQQEEVEAIGLASGIEKDLGAIDAQLAGGKLELGPVTNLISEGRNKAGLPDQNSANYASFLAMLEKMRNDSLRLNKGVQTEGDAVRAWNELIKNPTDATLVRQRIAEIRALNRRAVEERQFKLDTLRSNYGAGPLDTSQIRNAPPAIGAGAPAADEAPSIYDGMRWPDGRVITPTGILRPGDPGWYPEGGQPPAPVPGRPQLPAGAAGSPGAPAAPGPVERLPGLSQVRTAADYDALEPGAEYIDPNGNRRRKGQ